MREVGGHYFFFRVMKRLVLLASRQASRVIELNDSNNRCHRNVVTQVTHKIT